MTQKKSTKKLLFGKLMKGSNKQQSQAISSSSSSEKLNEANASGSATLKDNKGGKFHSREFLSYR